MKPHKKALAVLLALFSAQAHTVIDQLGDGFRPSLHLPPRHHAPLHHAVMQNNSERTRLLCRQPKINLDLQLNDGRTPLYLAAEINRPKVVEILIGYGADHTIENNFGSTPDQVTTSNEIRELLRSPKKRAACVAAVRQKLIAEYTGGTNIVTKLRNRECGTTRKRKRFIPNPHHENTQRLAH